MTEKLTPYDTGKRLQPMPWVKGPSLEGYLPSKFGKVDFDNPEGETELTVYVEKNEDDSFTLDVYSFGQQEIKVHLVQEDKDAEIIQPSAALQAKVREVINGLSTEIERDEAEVYWQPGKALILVPGETGYRKQQAIVVHEPGYPYADVDSAIVKGWATGTRDTRV